MYLLALGQVAFFGKQPVVAFYGPGHAAFFSNQPAVAIAGPGVCYILPLTPLNGAPLLRPLRVWPHISGKT
jgi:hypothetical protein